MAVHLLIVDALNLIRRIHAVQGSPCVETCQHALDQLIMHSQPTHAVAVFDDENRSSGWRHQRLPDYKAGRPPIPEELHDEMPALRAAFEQRGVPCWSTSGNEADDLAATLAVKVTQAGHQATIVSTDKGYCQLLSPTLRIRDYFQKRWLDAPFIDKEFGVQPQQLPDYIERCNGGGDIKLVVTDSQAFPQVNAMLPPHVPLTSFSILMARAKGPFEEYLRGMRAIDGLKSGDRVLILESCTHHVTCEDIGRVKIPGKLRGYLAKKNNDDNFMLEFDFVAGTDEIPHKDYRLAIQCGGCMVTKRELVNRVGSLIERNIPVTNYGMAIAFLSGITERVCYEPQK